MEISSISGSGWGFSSVSLHCPLNESTADLMNDTKVSIYPNPFNFSATIQINAPINDATLHLYNIYGQKVKTIEKISGGIAKIDRDNLPVGIYFMHLDKNGEMIVVQKIAITD